MANSGEKTLKQRILYLFNEIRYKAFQNDEEDMEAGASDSEQEERHEYTELLQGSVPCPSCKGSGRVPKGGFYAVILMMNVGVLEMEQQFVALIPINDERLEPKKTWRWIVGGASSCVILAMAAIFFLLPRPVHVSLPKAPVSRVNVVGKHLNGSESFMTFHFVNAINVTNQNLYPVNVVNASSTIVSDYYPLRQDIVGFGVSNYSMVLASEEVLHFNNTVSISGAQAVQCLGAVSTFSPAYITFSLEIVVVTEIFGHHQKLSFQANQHTHQLITRVPIPHFAFGETMRAVSGLPQEAPLMDADYDAFENHSDAALLSGGFWQWEFAELSKKEEPKQSEHDAVEPTEFFLLPSELNALSNLLNKAQLSDDLRKAYRHVWTRGASAPDLVKPESVAAELPTVAKYVEDDENELFTKLLWRIVRDKRLHEGFARALPGIVKNSTDEEPPSVSMIEGLLELYEAINPSLLYDLTRNVRKLYFSLPLHPWRLRGELIAKLDLALPLMNLTNRRELEDDLVDIGLSVFEERYALNRTAQEHFLASILASVSMNRVAYHLASKLTDTLGSSNKSFHRFSFASICQVILSNEMIDDETFDLLLGEHFFFYVAHDRAATIRGKFVEAFDRPHVKNLYGVPRKAQILPRMLRHMAEGDECSHVREMAQNLLDRLNAEKKPVPTSKPIEATNRSSNEEGLLELLKNLELMDFGNAAGPKAQPIIAKPSETDFDEVEVDPDKPFYSEDFRRFMDNS
ncbi:hypothetical protein QR680_007419 [Steinernema hermaphroditum]|uniref:Transmembrane protein 106 N-terminal domain-containing protein n=1 Tax=Steinernema hermaphroditum TaxID=289476 RepID=A0AA39IFL1_9BILA|nr:hypothetical protein QR680_007419 [Steinernema hermaphroditum]